MAPHEFLTWRVVGMNEFEEGAGRDNLNNTLSAVISKELKVGSKAIVFVQVEKKKVRKNAQVSS